MNTHELAITSVHQIGGGVYHSHKPLFRIAAPTAVMILIVWEMRGRHAIFADPLLIAESTWRGTWPSRNNQAVLPNYNRTGRATFGLRACDAVLRLAVLFAHTPRFFPISRCRGGCLRHRLSKPSILRSRRSRALAHPALVEEVEAPADPPTPAKRWY